MKTSATSGRDNVSFIWTAFCVLEFFIMKNYNVPWGTSKIFTSHQSFIRVESFAEQQIHEDMKMKSYGKKSKLSCIFRLGAPMSPSCFWCGPLIILPTSWPLSSNESRAGLWWANKPINGRMEKGKLTNYVSLDPALDLACACGLLLEPGPVLLLGWWDWGLSCIAVDKISRNFLNIQRRYL